MNGSTGTAGSAVGPAQRPIHARITESWDMLHSLEARFTELEERLIPVVTPLCDQAEKACRDQDPKLACSPVTDVFDSQMIRVQRLRDRLDSVLARLEV